MIEDQTSEIFCGVSKITDREIINDLDIVKCALTLKGKIMYIFRQPHFKSVDVNTIRKIQGMIGFKNRSIHKRLNYIGTIGMTESIEQLILLENGLGLTPVEIDNVAPSVNTKEEFIQIIDYYEKKYLAHNSN